MPRGIPNKPKKRKGKKSTKRRGPAPKNPAFFMSQAEVDAINAMAPNALGAAPAEPQFREIEIIYSLSTQLMDTVQQQNRSLMAIADILNYRKSA